MAEDSFSDMSISTSLLDRCLAELHEAPLRGACIIGQSGGPTAVINASALGAIQAALESPFITEVYGAANGIEGVLKERFFDMKQEDPAELELLKCTPASALGSCRYKMADPAVQDADYRRLLEVFRRYNVRYFFYNGGNDSMDTCHKISRYMASSGYECRVIGIPKTIDNDLSGTDHSPGFASAAKFIATSCMEVNQDVRVYDTGRVTVVEIMGRHAGWLAGSAALAGHAGAGPDLVYLPEVPFDMKTFLADVEAIYRRRGSCMVAVSEGIRHADGRFVAEAMTGEKDVFGHVQLGGLAAMLADTVKRSIGAKVRGIELSLLQRCASHIASGTDIDEAYMAGRAAVTAAVGGATGKMVAFKRGSDEGQYVCLLTLVDLAEAANVEKLVPRSWINEAGNGVTQPFIDYVLPLIQGEAPQATCMALPRFARLKKVPAARP